jgi:hypothetical protein
LKSSYGFLVAGLGAVVGCAGLAAVELPFVAAEVALIEPFPLPLPLSPLEGVAPVPGAGVAGGT